MEQLDDAQLTHLRSLRHKDRRPLNRRTSRPSFLELLEPRLALANVAVLSGHNDALLSGANTQETVLTPANVNPTNFGNLFNYAIDGYAYAQPLYVPNLAINGGTHNVVFAATEHDSVYAFDGDGGGQLWKRSFIDPANGITSVPQPDVISGDIVPEIGITGTPVIDSGTNTMYVVVKTKEMVGGVAHYVQRLHALDITTGQDRALNGVVTIGDTTIGGSDGGYTDNTPIVVLGTGAGSDGTTSRFNALRESNRAGLDAGRRQCLYRLGFARRQRPVSRLGRRLSDQRSVAAKGLQHFPQRAALRAFGRAAATWAWMPPVICTLQPATASALVLVPMGQHR